MRSPVHFAALEALLVLALAPLVACSEEALDPVPAPSSSPPDAGPTGGAPPDGPPVREVYMRNPLGGPAQNLLADGDFELSIVPSQAAGGQYGWIALTASGAPVAMSSETGGLCRTGLRCGRVPAGNVLFGRGTAAPNMAGHHASIWFKPLGETSAAKPCDVGNVYVLGCDTFDVKKALRAADAPDAQGFCEYSADLGGSPLSLCMYAEISGVDVLADSATLLPLPEGTLAPKPSPVALLPETRARIAIVRDFVRSHTPLSPPPVPDGEPTQRE